MSTMRRGEKRHQRNSPERKSSARNIIAKKPRIGNDLVVATGLVNFCTKKNKNGNLRRTALSDREVADHTTSRLSEHKHGLLPDMYKYDRVMSFGLIDNHYFALVVLVKEGTIHVIDSMAVSPAKIEKIGKVS